MEYRDHDKAQKAFVKLRRIMDSSMGGVYVFFGIAVYMAHHFGWNLGMYYRLSLGSLLTGYGLFRIYRGIKRFF